jgi:hypothetical protein
MISLYDELSEKIERDPRIASKNGARRDLGILLFSKRDDIDALWKAAERLLPAIGSEESAELRAAVEKLKPLFGERG